MPSEHIEFEVASTHQDALEACRATAQRNGWSAEAVGFDGLQVRKGLGLATWPVTLDVRLTPARAQATAVSVDGRVFGLGPVQKRALRKTLETFEREVSGTAPGSSTVPGAS